MDQRKADVALVLKYLTDETLKSFVQQLDEGCDQLEEISASHDIDDKTPVNGLRSYVKIVTRFFDQYALLLQEQVQSLPVSRKTRKLLKEYEIVTETLVKGLEMARQAHQRSGENCDNTEITDADCDILMSGFKLRAEDVMPFYSRVGPFWLRPSIIDSHVQNKRIVTCLSQSSFRKKVKVLRSKSYYRKAASKNAVNFPIKGLQSCANLKQFPTNVLMRLMKKPSGVSLKYIEIEAEDSEWLIDVMDTSAHAVIRQNPLAENERQQSSSSLSNNGKGKRRNIRCLVVTPTTDSNGKTRNKRNNVILHSHGGAFVTASPDNYLFLLSHWARELSVPILCPDYAKAPQNRFPAGLQDILTSYLFLRSGSEKIKSAIGFDPENVILSGDSAGGQLSVALTLALHRIRESGGEVSLPSGIHALYPCVTAGPIAFPSVSLVATDLVLSPGLCAQAFGCYADTETGMTDGWHSDLDAIVAGKMKELRSRVKDPLFNLMAFNGFAAIAPMIPLKVLVCEFDPVLDQGLALAKCWHTAGGQVSVQVAYDLPHGFPMSRDYGPIGEEMKGLVDAFAHLLKQEDSSTEHLV